MNMSTKRYLLIKPYKPVLLSLLAPMALSACQVTPTTSQSSSLDQVSQTIVNLPAEQQSEMAKNI